MTHSQLILMDDPTHGINLSKASHIVGKMDMNSWRYVQDFRVGREGGLENIPAHIVVPIESAGLSNIFTLAFFLKRPDVSPSYFIMTGDKIHNLPPDLEPETLANQNATSTGSIVRWSIVRYGEVAFLTRPTQKVRIVRYNSVSSVYELRTLDNTNPLTQGVGTSGTVNNMMPSGRFINMLFGHIVVAYTTETHFWNGTTSEAHANAMTYPSRIRWSQRDVVNQSLNNWNPGTGSNADFFDINSTRSLFSNAMNITGLLAMRNTLTVYTTHSIWEMTYVGPSSGIMNFRTVVNDIGCAIPYSAISFEDLHYFIGWDNIYVFDGASVTSIGTPIWSLLQLKADFSLVDYFVCWGEADFIKRTLHWTFSAREIGVYGFSLTYSVDDNAWTFTSANDAWTISRIPEFESNVVTPLVGSLVYYGGNQLTYELGPDLDITLQSAPNKGLLISHDIQFDSPEAVKEVTSLYLDGEVENIIYNSDGNLGEVKFGILVLLSVRNSTAEPLQFHYAGMWVPNESFSPNIPLSIRTSGRILNFAFLPLLDELVTDDESANSMESLFEKAYVNT